MYDDELVRAIRRKIAPDEMAALRYAAPLGLHSPRQFVELPLRADVKVAFDKGLAAFCVDATIRDLDPKRWLSARQYFSTREIVRSSDRAAVIEYLFDGMKGQFARHLAESELEKLINKGATK